MDNLSIDDVRNCLVECFGVEEDYLIPALFVADGDPEKLEKVLSYFSGDRFQKFTDSNIPHCEDCPVAYELMPDKFTLEIELGNSAMMNNEHLIDALTQLAERLGCIEYGKKTGKIQDRNGRSVGSWELK